MALFVVLWTTWKIIEFTVSFARPRKSWNLIVAPGKSWKMLGIVGKGFFGKNLILDHGKHEKILGRVIESRGSL